MASVISSKRRNRVKYGHANSLFDEWLKEWQLQAKNANSNMQYNFSRARRSLQLFPLPVYSGDDCKILKNFGSKICAMIDKKLAQHENEHGPIDWSLYIKADKKKRTSQSKVRKQNSLTKENFSPIVPVSSNNDGCILPVRNKRNQDEAGIAVPTFNMKKKATVNRRPKQSQVKKTSEVIRPAPAKVVDVAPYESNVDVAPYESIGDVAPYESNEVDVVPYESNEVDVVPYEPNEMDVVPYEPNEVDFAVVCDDVEVISTSDKEVLYALPSGTFTVVLCVDCAETTSKSGKQGVVKELSQNGVLHDIRKLHVGDFGWVARENTTSSGQKKPREIILPFLVERKRMDDLASSIKDGRCREQKHRLTQSGIDTVVYLVESTGHNHAGLPLSTCYQAVANTSVVDGMQVKWTRNYKETAAYLTIMTKIINNMYAGKTVEALKQTRLPSPCGPGSTSLLDFNAFNNSVVKNRQLTVQEMTAKHLIQLSGLSVQKVAAIVKETGTLAALIALLSTSDGVNKIAEFKGARSGRRIGAQAAESLRMLYTNSVLR